MKSKTSDYTGSYKLRSLFLCIAAAGVVTLSGCYAGRAVVYQPAPEVIYEPVPAVVVAPPWAPPYYYVTVVHYYFLPEINCYYNVWNNQFIYWNGWGWSPVYGLPAMYSGCNLYNTYVVVLDRNARDPWLRNDYYRNRYANWKSEQRETVRGFDENDSKMLVASSDKRNGVNENVKGNVNENVRPGIEKPAQPVASAAPVKDRVVPQKEKETVMVPQKEKASTIVPENEKEVVKSTVISRNPAAPVKTQPAPEVKKTDRNAEISQDGEIRQPVPATKKELQQKAQAGRVTQSKIQQNDDSLRTAPSAREKHR